MSNSRLDALRMVDPLLTGLATGYTNPSFIAHKVFPIINVAKMKGKIPIFGKEAFSIYETERAIRANSNRIPPPGTTMQYFETTERDIETAIDYLEKEESADSIKYEQKITKDLMDIILLGHEKEAADLLQNLNNFDTNLKIQLTSDNAINNYSASTSPIDLVNNAKEAIRSRIAKYPNTMIMGTVVYNALLKNPAITNMLKYSDFPAVNTEVLKKIFGVEDIYVGQAVYSEDGATFSDIWGDNILLIYVDKNSTSPSEFNPSFGYTFRREGLPEIDTYFENGGKIKVIRATDNYAIKVTAQDAAYLINNCII